MKNTWITGVVLAALLGLSSCASTEKLLYGDSARSSSDRSTYDGQNYDSRRTYTSSNNDDRDNGPGTTRYNDAPNRTYTSRDDRAYSSNQAYQTGNDRYTSPADNRRADRSRDDRPTYDNRYNDDRYSYDNGRNYDDHYGYDSRNNNYRYDDRYAYRNRSYPDNTGNYGNDRDNGRYNPSMNYRYDNRRSYDDSMRYRDNTQSGYATQNDDRMRTDDRSTYSNRTNNQSDNRNYDNRPMMDQQGYAGATSDNRENRNPASPNGEREAMNRPGNDRGNQPSTTADPYANDRRNVADDISESLDKLDQQIRLAQQDVTDESRKDKQKRDDLVNTLKDKRSQLIDSYYQVQRAKADDFKAAKREAYHHLDDAEAAMAQLKDNLKDAANN